MSTRLFVKGIIGLLLIGLVGISACVKRELPTESRLSMKEAGIPTTIEELGLPEIPDEENGALVYKEIFKLEDSLIEKYKELSDYFPYQGSVEWDKVPEEEKNKVINLILNSPDFAQLHQLLEKASQMECQFFKREDYKEGIEEISGELFTVLTYLRSCARNLAGKAKIEAEYGEIEKALSTSLTGLRIGKSLANEPFLISQLVRIAIDSVALSRLEEILNKGEGNMDLYQALLYEMEEERKRSIVAYSLKGEMVMFGMPGMLRERKLAVEACPSFEKRFDEITEKEKQELRKHFGDIGDDPEKVVKFIKEYWDEEVSVYIKSMSKLIPLCRKPYWDVNKKIEKIVEEVKSLPARRAVLSKNAISTVPRAYSQEAKLDAHLGAAEIAVANRIYKQKHGKYVDSLGQLTPEILPVLPLDPFTGKDYIYRRKDKGFIVYSLGENLRDDGGLRRKAREKDYDIVWECASW